MVLMTMIARIADGLPLAASMQEEEQVSVTLFNYGSDEYLHRPMAAGTLPSTLTNPKRVGGANA